MNDTTKPSEYLGYWGEKYKNDLLTDILPFWLKYGIDHENGEYTYARFPDKEYGEWFGYFHYDGTLSQPAKGNMYKGPFHIPRMLLKCHLLCKEIQGYDKQ